MSSDDDVLSFRFFKKLPSSLFELFHACKSHSSPLINVAHKCNFFSARCQEWYGGRLKEIPGIFSQGETLNELKANILDAYYLVLEESKESLPENIKNKVNSALVKIALKMSS